MSTVLFYQLTSPVLLLGQKYIVDIKPLLALIFHGKKNQRKYKYRGKRKNVNKRAKYILFVSL